MSAGVQKFAMQVLGPSISTDVVRSTPTQSKLQEVKTYPAPAAAVNGADDPLVYQHPDEQSGLTVPDTRGLTAVVRLYWVVKLAVYVVTEGETVIV